MKKSFLSSALVQVFALALFALGILVACALSINGPTKIGTVQTNRNGKIEGLTLGNFQQKNITKAELPMLTLDEGTTNATWGYVLLTHTNDVEFIVRHYKLKSVISGNFMDPSYVPGTLPIYSPGEGFYTPGDRHYLTNTPPQFLAVFWL